MADTLDIVALNQSVVRSEDFITTIRAALTEQLHGQPEAADPWLREVSQVDLKRKSPRIIIGVVGATGSGKSSIINAVLDETQLVPTNCMRACTAVVTEISFNDGPTRYRAKIEFVSRREWQDELELLLGDIVAGGRVANNINDDNSEAGIAFAKVQAVYPHMNKHNLAQATVTELLDCTYIKEVVGTEIEFCTDTAEELHYKIQKYVDSKEKLSEDYAQHGLQASSALDEIAYWPLIRSVCIYTKSDILKSGSVLVDLPGVADSNAARAAIAQKYLQKCAALWIVAPIIRAVDDKSARFLLGESFKRQLWRDGTLQRLTFICSKTDEISISEARASLERYPKLREQFAQIDADRKAATTQRDALVESLLEVKQRIVNVTKLYREAISEEKEYKELRSRAKAGQSVYPLTRVEVTKRSAEEADFDADPSPLKKTKHGIDIAASFQSPGKRPALSSDSIAAVQVQFREDKTKSSLTVANLKARLDNLKGKKNALRAERQASKENELELMQARADNKSRIAEIGAEEWVACVLGRNEISAHSIRIDFAAGLRDIVLDENDEAIEDGDLKGDDVGTCDVGTEQAPQIDLHALPVFCVSAKGYYKVSGDMEIEKIAACFDTAEATGIPALREHVSKLGHDKQIASMQCYVNEAKRLLTSLRLWSSGETASNIAETEGHKNEEYCLQLVKDLVSGILQIANTVMDTITNIVASGILTALPRASKLACDTAILTVMQWVASRTANPPGLRWNTFKAVVRRSGTWAHPRRTLDFNADLLQPYMRSIDTRWNETFNVKVEKAFRKALGASARGLDTFVEPFGARLGSTEQSTVRELFEEQVKLFTKSLGIIFKSARKAIDEHQKEANRLFEESVRTNMKGIYADLEDEEGPGFYDRCKEKLKVYVDENKDVMFDKVSQRIKTKLQTMLVEVRATLLTEIQSTCDSLQRDCRSLCQKSRDFEVLPDAAQKAIIKVLADADVALAAEDQIMTDMVTTANQDGIIGGSDHGKPYAMSMRSMTPVLMATSCEQDWSDSDSVVVDDDGDDSDDEEDTDEQD